MTGYRVKKIFLREIPRELIRDSMLKCFGKKSPVVFDVRGVECWFLEEGCEEWEVSRDVQEKLSGQTSLVVGFYPEGDGKRGQGVG